MDRRTHLLLALLAAAATLVTRLPILFSRTLSLDGDESILGLMALHLSEGRGAGVFFAGQRYGFSLLESAAAAAGFRLAGVSDGAIHAAMLVLWAAGAFLAGLAAGRIAGRRSAFLAVALMAACPAWGIWSTKARGGYVTAFLLTGLLLYLVAWRLERGAGAGRERSRGGSSGRPAFAVAAAIGGSVALLAFSQPIWIASVLPLLLLYLLHVVRRRAETGGFIAGGAVLGILLFALSRAGSSGYWAPPLFRDPDVGGALAALPERVWVAMAGAHVGAVRVPFGAMAGIAAAVWCAILAAVTIAPLVRFARARRLDVPGALALGIVLHLCASLAIGRSMFAYRYLLPLAAPAVVIASVESPRLLGRLRGGPWAGAIAPAVLLILGMGAFLDQARIGGEAFDRGGSPSTAEARDLVRRLDARGVAAVYCSDPLFQWRVMFESRGRIPARWLNGTDRIPEYPAAVDRAFRQGRPVALVLCVDDPAKREQLVRLLSAGDPAKAESLGDRFVVDYRPNAEILGGLGFRIGPY